MRHWLSQIMIGIIVTVVGTVVANSIVGGHARHAFPGSHFSALARHR